MVKKQRCPECGSDLPKNAPEGLCPKCLIRMGFEGEADIYSGSLPINEGPGSSIGRYRLLELLGEGGMGLVYLAEQQEPVCRKVALKIVKLGMDTIQVVARFQAEQQTLAILEHPNIAQVFDAGTTDSGRPYFVMEYVKGLPITEYCDKHKIGIDERLQLFLHVCHAIQHAHQKGVLHRDIKPSNILVADNDHTPMLKIIDFGIAKAITQPLCERTAITEQGQLLGTPEYMSPEQADMAYEDVDTRSDVYSLGVVLYELLAGATPFDEKTLRKGGIDHIREVIRDQEPITPSARLTGLGNHAKEIALMRRTQILTLARRLRKELEWIPLKAIRKEPDHRYESVSQMANDVSNYLEGTALIAGPESKMYRARKFVRKHAGSVTTVALIAIAIIIGLVTSMAMGFRAERARRQESIARSEAEKARVHAEQAQTAAHEERKVAEEQADKYRYLSYVYGVTLADVKYREGNLRNARELLKSCPQGLRNWEWYRLSYIMDESVSTLGSGFPASSVAFSPDGKHIASGNLMGGQIKIWDVETGAEMLTIEGHKARAILSVQFSPDGTRIVSSSADCTIKLWDTVDSSEILTFEGHQKPVRSVAFSPNGNQIVSGSFDSTVRLWDVSTGEELRVLSGHNNIVCCVAFSPDGRHIASGSYDQTVKIWDAMTGKELKTFNLADQKVLGISYSSDGKRIAVSCFGGAIRVLDATSGAQLLAPKGHTEGQPVVSIAFSPDGKRIVSGSYDNTVKVWDATTGEELTTFVGHAKGVGCVAFSPDGKRIASTALPPDSGGIKIWDVSTDKECTILRGHKQSVCRVSFTPDGGQLLSGDINGTIKIWDVSEAREIRTVLEHGGPISCMASSPDGRYLVSGGDDTTLRVWDMSNGREIKKLSGHNKAIYSVAFSPDGNRILSGSIDGTAKVWDRTNGEEIMSLLGPKQSVLCVAFNPDGKQIATGGIEIGNEIKLWNASTGEEIKTLSGHKSGVRSILFTPDGSRLVSGAGDATIRIWDTKTGDELMTLYGHKDYIELLAISPDGTRIVSVSHDGTTKVWDTATGVELMTLPGISGGIAFSPDGSMIAGGGGPQDGDITLWKSGIRPTVGSSGQSDESTRKVVD